jgi:hypothetical protein
MLDVAGWDLGANGGKPVLRLAVEAKWADHTSGPLDGLWQALLYRRAFQRVYIASQLSLIALAPKHTFVADALCELGIGYIYVPLKQERDCWIEAGAPTVEIESSVSPWLQPTTGPVLVRNRWEVTVVSPKGGCSCWHNNTGNP